MCLKVTEMCDQTWIFLDNESDEVMKTEKSWLSSPVGAGAEPRKGLNTSSRLTAPVANQRPRYAGCPCVAFGKGDATCQEGLAQNTSGLSLSSTRQFAWNLHRNPVLLGVGFFFRGIFGTGWATDEPENLGVEELQLGLRRLMY